MPLLDVIIYNYIQENSALVTIRNYSQLGRTWGMSLRSHKRFIFMGYFVWHFSIFSKYLPKNYAFRLDRLKYWTILLDLLQKKHKNIIPNNPTFVYFGILMIFSVIFKYISKKSTEWFGISIHLTEIHNL